MVRPGRGQAPRFAPGSRSGLRCSAACASALCSLALATSRPRGGRGGRAGRLLAARAATTKLFGQTKPTARRIDDHVT